ncbi:MAG TPA: glycine zipper 2TM domain-containing protein [Gammaproteobacteria bacterium]
MNKRLLFIPLMMGLASAPLYAGEYHRHGGFQDKARVVEVIPLYEVVEVPRESRDCWTEEVHGTRSGSSGAGMVVGSIIGGVVGHQVGRGDGRKLATVAGTVIGAAVGADADRQARREPYTTSERHCQVRTDYVREERLRAYQVTYRYHGETFVTEMDHHPGKFVPVRVQVSLME